VIFVFLPALTPGAKLHRGSSAKWSVVGVGLVWRWPDRFVFPELVKFWLRRWRKNGVSCPLLDLLPPDDKQGRADEDPDRAPSLVDDERFHVSTIVDLALVVEREEHSAEDPHSPQPLHDTAKHVQPLVHD